tara:strand:- start:155 stop:346 length:192 start_codon:yes stop_codon:yes gene_type:complete
VSKYKFKIVKKYYGGIPCNQQTIIEVKPILDADKLTTDAEKQIARQLQFNFEQQMEQVEQDNE